MEWQPIETAPKDQDLVIVWDFDAQEAVFASFCDFAWRHEWGDVVAASHWLPILPPKEAIEAAAKKAAIRAAVEKAFDQALGDDSGPPKSP